MKTCFKCLRSLPVTEFYRHSHMADGRLGKCKQCTKKDVEDRRQLKLATDLEWTLRERERHRLRAARVRQTKRQVVTIDARRLYFLRQKAAYPEKYAAQNAVSNAIRSGRLFRQPCQSCGAKKTQAHHDDYSKPLKVKWLCVAHHTELHRKLRAEELRLKFQ